MSSADFHRVGGGIPEPGPVFTLGHGDASHLHGRRKGGHGHGKHSPSSSHAHKHLPRSASAAPRSGMSDADAAVTGAAGGGLGATAPIFNPPASVSLGNPQPAPPAAPAFGTSQPAFHIGSSAGSPPSARKPWGRSQSARHRSSSALPKEPLESLFAAAVATPLPQTSTADKQQLPESSSADAVPPAPVQAPQPPAAPPQPSGPPAAPAPNAVPLPSASLAAAAAAAKAPSGVQQAARSSGSSAPAENGPAERPHSTLGDSSTGPAKAEEHTREDFAILSERFRRLMQSAQEAVPDAGAPQQHATGPAPVPKAPAPAFPATAATQNPTPVFATAPAASAQAAAAAAPAPAPAAAAAVPPQAPASTFTQPGAQPSPSSAPSFAAAAPAAAVPAAAAAVPAAAAAVAAPPPGPAPLSTSAGAPAPGPTATAAAGPSMGPATGHAAPTAAAPFMAPLFTAGSQAAPAAATAGAPSGATPPSPAPAPAAPDVPKFTFGTAGGGTPGSAGKHSARRRGGRGRATPSSPGAASTPTPSFSEQAASNPPGSATTTGATHPGYSPMAWSPQYEPGAQGAESGVGNQGAAASTPPRLFGIGSVGSAFSSGSPDQMANEGGEGGSGADSGFAGPGASVNISGAGLDTSGLSSGFGSNAFGESSLGSAGWGAASLNSFGSAAFSSAAPPASAFTADALSAGHKQLDQMHRQHAQAQAQAQQAQQQQQQQQQHKAQMHAQQHVQAQAQAQQEQQQQQQQQQQQHKAQMHAQQQEQLKAQMHAQQQQEQQQQQQRDTSLPKDADSKRAWAADGTFSKDREQQQQVPVFRAGVHANQQQQQQQIPVFGAEVRANQQQQQQQQQVPVFGAGVRANSQPPPAFTSHFPFEFSSPGGTTHRTKSASVAAQAHRAGSIPSFNFVAAPPQPIPTAVVPPPSTSSTAGSGSNQQGGPPEAADGASSASAAPEPMPPGAAPADASAAAAAAASHHRRYYRARSSGRMPQHGDGSASSEQQAAAQHQQWKQSSRSAQPTGRQIQASNAKLKGNADYAAQNYQSAESAYTAALELLRADGIGGTEAAVLHSNRAGARLMVGKPAAALADALMAVQLDPKFFKAVSRAATCHCRMGDFASAKRILDKVLDKLSASSTHFQDIYKKLHEVEALTRSMDVVSNATLKHKAEKDSLLAALNMLDAVHPQVVYSEPMAALRVRTLLACNRPSDALSAMEVHYEAPSCIRGAPWRSWLGVQARYHMGDMAGAIQMCEQLRQKLEYRAQSSSSSNGASSSTGLDEEAAAFGGNSETALAFAALRLPTKEELGHLLEHMKNLQSAKAEGNTAVKNGNHQLAVDKYTAALSHNAPPVFAAVLYSNRAAAHQGLGQLTDAMADCARARALDPSYVRATTRLATLLQDVRRSELAADILTTITQGSQDSSSGLTPSERQAITNQIATARATAAWQKTHDHYRVMGLERGCSEDEVRKTYRKAALKYHPDKAATLCRFNLVPPLGPDSKSLQAEGELVPVVFIAGQGPGVDARVLAEANWLFSLIGQAHEELSDKAKRRRYDMLLDAEHPPPTKTRYASTNPYTRYDPFAGFPGYGSFRKPSSGRPSAGPSYASGAGGARSGASNFSSFGARNFNSRGTSSTGSTGYGAGPQGRTSNPGSRPQHKSSWYRRASHAFSESDDDEDDTY